MRIMTAIELDHSHNMRLVAKNPQFAENYFSITMLHKRSQPTCLLCNQLFHRL